MSAKSLFRNELLLAAAALALAAGGCSSKSAQSAGPTRAAAVPVVVADVQQKTVPVQLKGIGRVETLSSVQVKPQAGGEILNVHFQPGQDVKKGDLLFRIDSKPFEVALQQAEANLARNQALLENARIQARRYEALAEQGIVAKQLAEQMTSSADAYEAAVKSDQAAVEEAKLRISYCTVTAPMSGRTGSLLVFPGTLVRANDTQALVVINQLRPIYVEFAVPEQNLPAIQRQFGRNRMRVTAHIADDNRPAEGALSFVDNSVDRATGTIRLRATFENEDTRLWPGQFVNITLTLAEEANALVVPSVAVQSGQAGTYVYVLKGDETVEMRAVTVARTQENWTVIGSGVRAGETVVTDGHLALVPGSKVSIKSRQ
jgi:multidrug efflux system membrane fusion protein